MFPHHSLDLAVVASGSIPLLTPCYNMQTYSSDWAVRSNDYSEDTMHSTSTSFLMAQRWPCSALSVTIALRTWSAYICTWLDTTLFTRNNCEFPPFLVSSKASLTIPFSFPFFSVRILCITEMDSHAPSDLPNRAEGHAYVVTEQGTESILPRKRYQRLTGIVAPLMKVNWNFYGFPQN